MLSIDPESLGKLFNYYDTRGVNYSSNVESLLKAEVVDLTGAINIK